MSKFDPLRELLAGMHGQPLALDETRGLLIHSIARELHEGRDVSDARLAAACGRASKSLTGETSETADALGATFKAAIGSSGRNGGPQIVTGPKGGKVAVIGLRGLINHGFDFQPYAADTGLFARNAAEAAGDRNISSIVLDVDSGGGFVTGVPEASDAVYAARQVKPVLAIVGAGMMASAAYWIGASASAISALSSGEGVGSIGVRAAHVDVTGALEKAGVRITEISSGKFKNELSPYRQLSPEALAHYQAESDRVYQDFLGAVARGRGVPVATVVNTFGQGRVIEPVAAKARGMLDHLESGDAAFTRALNEARAPKTAGQIALELARMDMEI